MAEKRDDERLIKVAMRLNAGSAVLLLIVFALTNWFAYTSIDSELAHSARKTALRFYDNSIGREDKLDRVLGNGRLEYLEGTRILASMESANVLNYRVRDATGQLHLAAKQPLVSEERVLRMSPFLARARETKEVQVKPPARDRADQFVSNVVIPIIRDGRAIGTLSVEVDEQEASELAYANFYRVSGLMAILLVLGLAANGVMAFLLRRQKAHEGRIRHMALHDPLTGLANRAAFADALKTGLAAAHQTGEPIALHLSDVDRFKSINDLLGHEMGDDLLCMAAQRLQSRLGHVCTIARLGGDEFAIIQHEVRDEEDASRVGQLVVDALRSIDNLKGTPVSVSASVGTVVSRPGRDGEDMQRLADAALYYAKEAGRDQSVTFKDGMEETVRRRSALRAMVRAAINEQSFEVFYQPIHDAGGGALVGFEALLRMPDGNGGHVSPADFIPVAEEMTATPLIGEWVLIEATMVAATWPDPLRVSVNLSPQQFKFDLVGIVERALANAGLPAHRLELEVTENLCVSDPALVEHELKRLKALGVRIVMDDFGTGYSSLQHLWSFPFDKLKVDRSCMMSLDKGDRVAEILRTISAMSGAMNLTVTAEGVETAHQADFARDAGYHEVQGFLYSRPMPTARLAEYIGSSDAALPLLPPPDPSRPSPIIV